MISTQSHVRAQSIWIVLLDIVCLLASSMLAVWIRFGPEGMPEYFAGNLNVWVMFFGSIVIANYLAGNYRVQYSLSRFNLLVTWMFSITFAVLVMSLTSYAWMMKIMLGRGVLMLSVIFYSSFSLFLRLVAYRPLFSRGFLMKRVVVIGHGEQAHRLRKYLENPYILPLHRVVAWIRILRDNELHASHGEVDDAVPVIETCLDDICDVVTGLNANMVVLDRNQAHDMVAAYHQLRRLRFMGIEVLTPLAVAEIYTGRTPLDLLDEDTLMISGISSWPVVWRLKRILDLLVSIVAALICLPLSVLIALAIKLENPGAPVIYTQTRVGQFGKYFKIYKFRTMREDAESETGAVWAQGDDPRITKVGKVLRKYRLDEIPQFWNIFKGDMSMVGPRPERPELSADLARQIPFYDEREYAMPGLTGWAQIQYVYGSSVEDAKRKLEYDLFYIRNISLSLDLQIVLRTLRIVLLGKERE